MSYDYNALVTTLSSHRESAALAHETNDNSKYVENLQNALQVFETLSGHCPMTPLLWLQYSYDMYSMMTALSNEEGSIEAAKVARLQTMELALAEFPGCAVLQLHYCELLVESLKLGGGEGGDYEVQVKTVNQALLRALKQVGSGSHRNEGDVIALIYRLHAHFAITFKKDQDSALASLLQRAKTPMENANDSLMQEIHSFCDGSKIPIEEEFLPTIEEARRWEAKAYSRLRSCEDEITMAMHQEQISYNNHVDFSSSGRDDDSATTYSFVTTTNEFNSTVMRARPEKSQRYWMALGGAATARAFQQYFAACRKFRFPKDSSEEKNKVAADQKRQQQDLILSVYERAIAECPTVEALWLAYLKHLTFLWNNDPTYAPSPQVYKTISTRAIRNCPFSLSLTQQQMHVSLLLANKDRSEYVLDPDELLQFVNKALDFQFLRSPAHAFDLFVTAIRTIQRRILFLLANSVLGVDPTKKTKQAALLNYDDAELLPSKVPKRSGSKAGDHATPRPLDDDSWQEVQDLCEEIRDMFQAALDRLNKDHASWTEGRSMLLHEQGLMERVVIGPLLSTTNNNVNSIAANGIKSADESLADFEKAIRVHHPPHPDSYRALIEHVLHHGAATTSTIASKRNPGDVLSRLRHVRGLYQKAIQSVGKSKVKDEAAATQTATSTAALRDYETALSCLAVEYQEFERVFGSEQSLANAMRSMQKKLQKTTFQAGRRLHSSTPSQPTKSQDGTPMAVDEGKSDSPAAKRKASEADGKPNERVDQKPPNKRRKKEMKRNGSMDESKGDPAQAANSNDNSKPVNKQQEKGSTNVQPKQHHKVKIGTIFHRAHPYTIRISNLALETEEMDIIEAFKQEHKCGAVVHCRVQREKALHTKGKKGKIGESKGWGLLQFEERESVEKALDLDQKVELHGNALKLERSHVPAVGIVPPGMHRPKQSKQSTSHIEGGKAEAKLSATDGDSVSASSAKAPSSGGSSLGILAFRPRGVSQKRQQPPKKARPKTKLDLTSADDSNTG